MDNDNILIENIGSGFEQIIQYHIDKGELHQKTAADAISFSKYLEAETVHTKRRLREVVEKINYETIKPETEYKIWPDMEFWRGVDDYGSSVALNYDGGVDILKGQEPVVNGRYDGYTIPSDADRLLATMLRKSIKIDLGKYPLSLLGYYEYKFNETALFYAWIGYLWQEIEG